MVYLTRHRTLDWCGFQEISYVQPLSLTVYLPRFVRPPGWLPVAARSCGACKQPADDWFDSRNSLRCRGGGVEASYQREWNRMFSTRLYGRTVTFTRSQLIGYRFQSCSVLDRRSKPTITRAERALNKSDNLLYRKITETLFITVGINFKNCMSVENIIVKFNYINRSIYRST